MGQSNLLDLLLLRQSDTRRNKRNYDGEVIDLTSDGEPDKEITMANEEDGEVRKITTLEEDQIVKDEFLDEYVKEEIPKDLVVGLEKEQDGGELELGGSDRDDPDSDPNPDQQVTDAHGTEYKETLECEIPCPVCLLDIAKLSLSDRESHVELCLLQPTTHKSIIKPSPKKSKPLKQPKQPRQPKPRTRQIPDFKILSFKNNHKIIVDGFQFMDHPDIDQYFLSHYHSDHYIGLGKNWQQGKIYSSVTTANLLKTIMKLPDDKVIGIPLNEPFKIHERIEITLFDANHCPGGVIFFFQEYNEKGEVIKRILHTGDFRVSYDHIKIFKNIFIDEIFLDTTYLNPVYTFMPQIQVVNKTSTFIKHIVDETIKKNSILNYFTKSNDYLIIIGAYSIGKEKLYINLAKTINSKILITKDRYKMLSCIDGFKDLNIFQFEESKDCKIQIVSINKLSDLKFLSKFQNKKIIKIKPTGWSFNTFKKDNLNKGKSLQEILQRVLSTKDPTIDNFENQLSQQFQKSSSLNVPYSEHSSFKELSIFASFLKWGQIIPTVNVENESFKNWFELWKSFQLDESLVEDYFNPNQAN